MSPIRDPKDPHTILAALSRERASLELTTYDLCCLAGLYLYANRDALAAFDDDRVIELFLQVCDVVEPGAENPRKRATHAIQRLRDQRLLARVDGAGLARAGEYTLTSLAAAIVEAFIADEALTRESLTLLTRTLLAQLAEIRRAAERAKGPEAWAGTVIGPLRVTVGDLVRGIERRQRGLDATQEELQRHLARMLESDWNRALDEAEDVLDRTTATLKELNEVLLKDSQQFVALLQEVDELAERAGCREGQEVAQQVIAAVDRIGEWGDARQRAWSEYYQFAHRYLRDVVRLDPDRAISARLRDQLVGWIDRPLHLTIVRAPPTRMLRDVSDQVERPPVSRRSEERERDLEEVEPGEGEFDLVAMVNAALAGSDTLSRVTETVLAALPPHRRFGDAGRVAALVARLARPKSSLDRPWVPVAGDLEIQDWELPARGGKP